MIVVLIMWLSAGGFSLGYAASRMGYARWSDLGVIPFGIFWVMTSYWWDENGKRLWTRKGKP